ncbi:MAG: helix-turn-helix transcriptional regulator [Clostridia bacterium]|nr:helix-turn-helix transcriptional regulator [Clostridia bacterium]
MLPDKLVGKLSSFFKVLGDDTRVKIIYALSRQELCVTDIAAQLDISQSAISHQLKQLRAEGLVRVRRDGKNIFYALDDNHVLDIINVAISHIRHKVRDGEL